MNNIQNIFDKEKNELIFKNNTLQTNLDKVKLTLLDQINSLNSQLEDINNKYSSNLRSLKEASENQLRSIIDEKDETISKLNGQIKHLEKIIDELNTKVTDNLKVIHDLKNNYTNTNSELETSLKQKDEEIIKLKELYEAKITSIENFHQNEKNKLITNYENNINKYCALIMMQDNEYC